jgi:hypothetical protein
VTAVERQAFPYASLALTRGEIRWLRSLRIPDWLLDEFPSQPERSCRHNRQSTNTLRRLYERLCTGGQSIPLLEGKRVTRHYLNRKVIVAVGEYESLCALQGVGIHLRRGTYRSEILLERKQLCRQIVRLAYSVLFPKRPPLGADGGKHLVPFPPPPFSTRQEPITQESRDDSGQISFVTPAAIAGVTRKLE